MIGVALQKNYISVYSTPTKVGRPLTDFYAGRLGALRTGKGNFSFVAFADLDQQATREFFAEAQYLFNEIPSSMARFDRIA